MSRFKQYRGLNGEAVPILASSIASRTSFPIAEFADQIASGSQRDALANFSMQRDYASVRSYAAGQLRRHELGLEARAAPLQYGR